MSQENQEDAVYHLLKFCLRRHITSLPPEPQAYPDPKEGNMDFISQCHIVRRAGGMGDLVIAILENTKSVTAAYPSC